MRDDLAALRYPADERYNKATQRVDLFLGSGECKIDPGSRIELVEIEARVGFVFTRAKFSKLGRFLGVVFVVDIAYDFFDQILDRDKSVRAAIFINHERQMDMRRLHFHEQITRGHRRRHEDDVALDPRDGNVRQAHGAVGTKLEQRQNVFYVNETDGIVQRLAVNRKTRMLRLPKTNDQLIQRRHLFHADDIAARNHHVVYPEFAEFEQVREHDAFLRRKGRALPVAFLDDLLETLANGLRAVIPAQNFRQALKQRFAVGSTVCGTVLRHARHL